MCKIKTFKASLTKMNSFFSQLLKMWSEFMSKYFVSFRVVDPGGAASLVQNPMGLSWETS